MPAAAVILVLVTTAGAQSADAKRARPNADAASQPRVLVLANQLDPSGMANISLSYTKTVPDADARRDFDEIARGTGWTILEGPTLSASPGSKPETPAMSSVEFTAANALPSTPGSLPIEPLALALKRFTPTELVFIMRPDFQFRGLRDFENEFVDIHLRRNANAYSYRLRIKRADFTRLNLPGIVPVGRPAAVPPPPAQSGGILWPLMIALAIGAVVWLIAYQSQKRGRT